MEPRGSMEDLGDAGSNALVAVTSYYTKLLQAARQREAALLQTARVEFERGQSIREDWAKADRARLEAERAQHLAEQQVKDLKAEVRALSKPTGTVGFVALDYVGDLAERARWLTRITPVLESLVAFMVQVKFNGAPENAYDQALATLHERWMATGVDGGVVPPPAPAHPDAPRAAPARPADGPPGGPVVRGKVPVRQRER